MVAERQFNLGGTTITADFSGFILSLFAGHQFLKFFSYDCNEAQGLTGKSFQ